MEKAKDAFRKLPREQQQEELLKIWNEANIQAYPTDTQKNPDDKSNKSEDSNITDSLDTKKSFSRKIDEKIK